MLTSLARVFAYDDRGRSALPSHPGAKHDSAMLTVRGLSTKLDTGEDAWARHGGRIMSISLGPYSGSLSPWVLPLFKAEAGDGGGVPPAKSGPSRRFWKGRRRRSDIMESPAKPGNLSDREAVRTLGLLAA